MFYDKAAACSTTTITTMSAIGCPKVQLTDLTGPLAAPSLESPLSLDDLLNVVEETEALCEQLDKISGVPNDMAYRGALFGQQLPPVPRTF